MISKRERKDVLQISSAHPLDRFLWPEVTVCCSADRTIRPPTAEIVKSQRRQRWWSSRSSVKSVYCAKRGDPFSGFSLAPKLLFNTTPTATFKLKPCGVEGAEQSRAKHYQRYSHSPPPPHLLLLVLVLHNFPSINESGALESAQ